MLACPHCEQEQIEPGLAISTFCRSCGKHFQIENGVALPPFGAGDPGPRFRSTVVEGDGSIGPGFDLDEPGDTSSSESEPVAPTAKRSFFGFIRSLQSADDDSAPVEPEKKPIRCFECGHIHEVSVAASSTQCARCSLYISLSDVHIREQYSRNIRTRGDVTIYRKGSVVGCEIACHNLNIMGRISGSVDCSGNATFKNSGKVIGSMHCKHIIVDKKCEVDFPQGIIAESADIYGVVRGDILCSGTVHIFKTGSVLGDATAKAIVMKDGGVLTGQMNIQHDADISLPAKGTVRPEPPTVTAKKTETPAPKMESGESDPKNKKKPDSKSESPKKAKSKVNDSEKVDESAQKAEKIDEPASKKEAGKADIKAEPEVKDDNKEANEDDEPFKLVP